MFGKITFTQNQITAVTWAINIVMKIKAREPMPLIPKPTNYITWARSRCHREI